MRIRTYDELVRLPTIEERFDYLALNGRVGGETFGYDRYLNQKFYTSREWRHIRQFVLARDNGCDLAVEGFDIHHRPVIHHMNPIQLQDLTDFNEDVLNPSYLITVSHSTHNGIHYGDRNALPASYSGRSARDTLLW